MFAISPAQLRSAVVRTFEPVDLRDLTSELGQPAPASAIAAAPLGSLRAALDRNLGIAEALEDSGADEVQGQQYRCAADRLSAILDYIG